MPIRLNSTGGGAVTITAPYTASTYTLTAPTVTANIVTDSANSITQSMMSTGLAGTGPAFSAYLSSNQSISPATATKIQLNTKEYDTANCFDNTTNYRYTPNVAGYYQITANWALYAGGSVYSNSMIYKNGSFFKSLQTQNSSGIGTLVTALIYMNGSTDYLEFYASHSTGSGNYIYGSQGYTYLCGYLARSA